MKHHILTLTLMTLMASSAYAHDHKTHWGYTGHGSPESWGDLSPEFAMCSQGKNQSPIDIVSTVQGDLPLIQPNYTASNVSVLNNGHTIQVNFQSAAPSVQMGEHKVNLSKIIPQSQITARNTLQLNGETYTLRQFHFHVPSENMIKGKSFPLEAHFVHSNDKGQLAVLGVLYEKSSEDNPHIQTIWDAMPTQAGSEVPLNTTFDPSVLLPKNLDYYRFSGSLTTPPCSEGVSWLVLKHYDTISDKQVKQFRDVMGGDNNRPVQPVNARVVVE